MRGKNRGAAQHAPPSGRPAPALPAITPTPAPVGPTGPTGFTAVVILPSAEEVQPEPPSEPVREVPRAENPVQETHPETDRGYDLLRLRRMDDARKAFEAALASGEKPKGLAHAGLARVLYLTNRFPEAEQSARKALTSSGGESARVVLGNALLELGKYEEAVREYDRVLQHDPGNREAERNRARALRSLGRSP